jgi:2-methylisocitrate lyase-like PEP mutase family enzyme
VSVGAHDVFTALLVEAAGFETVFLGGFGASASLLGQPDYGLITLSEMADQGRRMASRVRIPVIADGDDGHGDLHNAVRTLELFEQAGAAGILIEDQVHPKKCGHFEDKRVVGVEEAVRKLRAVLQARRDPELVVIGRTDARAVLGLEAAIDRAKRFRDIGCDLVFIEAPQSRAELERISREVQAPMLANMLTGGKTPILKKRELEQLGFKIAVYPIESLMALARSFSTVLSALRRDGDLHAVEGSLAGFSELKEILRLSQVEKLSGPPA